MVLLKAANPCRLSARRPARPPEEIGRAVLKEIPRTRFLFWVDFTAGKVEFRRG
jgi:hypothetical protein